MINGEVIHLLIVMIGDCAIESESMRGLGLKLSMMMMMKRK